MNATVYINGHQLGMHPYGYTTFFHDLTPHLKLGATNVLAVRVDQSRHKNTRWYAGSGIYRHVWLHLTEPVHVAHWGVSVTTPGSQCGTGQRLDQDPPRQRIGRPVHGDAAHRRLTARREPRPASRSRALPSSRVTAPRLAQEIAVAKPALWAPENPSLYRAVTRVISGGKMLDEVTTPFGIRSIEWSVEKGFLLNGKPVEMAGGCVHHDNGPLGAAAFDRAEERRVQLLKAAGFNAIRTAHNPPSPAFLDACDRLGMLVMDESFDCWAKGKNPHDYSVAFKDWWQRDTDAMVLRDRNHPSVVMWSIGNEIPERGDEAGAGTAKTMADYLRGLDRTRPITSALNGVRAVDQYGRLLCRARHRRLQLQPGQPRRGPQAGAIADHGVY